MTKCPLCGNDKPTFKNYLYDDDGLCWDKSILVYQCLSCGLYYSVIKEDLHEIYTNDYYVFDTIREKCDQAFAEHCCSWLNDQIPLCGKTLLDVGSGKGYFCEMAKTKNALVTGIEPVPAAANEAHKRTGITIHNAYFEDLNITTKYDIVTMWDVLEHFQNPRRILTKIKNTLTPNGLLVMSVPNKGSIFSYISGAYWKGYNKYHICHYKYRLLISLLESSGLEIVKHETFDNSLLSPEGIYRLGVKDRLKSLASRNSYLRAEIIKRRGNITDKNIVTGHNDYLATKDNTISQVIERFIKKVELGDQLRIICKSNSQTSSAH